MTRTFTKGDARKLREFAVEAARLLSDRHCEDVRLLDVRGLSHVCDYVLVATGTSDRQMQSVADELADLGREADHPSFRSSRDRSTTWIVVDFIDLIGHLFEPNQRAYYDLESLWSDAIEVQWRRNRAGDAPGVEPGVEKDAGATGSAETP